MIPKVFIADDHPIVISGIRNVLNNMNIYIVGVANDGRSALSFIIKTKPDIAILDIDMPYMTGIEIAKFCKKNNFKTKIILITLHKEVSYYIRSKELNIHGYLLKEFAVNEIEECINEVLHNKTYYSKKIKEFLGFTEESKSVLQDFSLKEIRILKLIMQRKSNTEIARILFLSPRTVEKYRSKMILKLNLERTSGSLVEWVFKNKHLFH